MRRIEAASRPTGGSWSAPIQISSAGAQGFPVVALDAQGDALAAWRRTLKRAGAVVQAVSRPVGGSWSPPATISGQPAPILLPQLVLDSSGDAVTVWGEGTGSTWTIQAANRPAAGSWTPALPISDGNILATNSGARNPPCHVALDDNGDAVAVWTQMNASRPSAETSDFNR
jgi:hypothetical protein